jgi:L-fuconolactonase
VTRVDTHTHVVSADRESFPIRPTGVGRPWWTEPGRDAAALLQEMDAAGIEGAILVQPIGAYGYDCSYMLEAAASCPDRLSAVTAVDLDDPAVDDRRLAELADTWAARPAVVGVRLFGVAPGSAWPADPARAEAALSAVGRAGLVAVLTVFAHQLDQLTGVVGRAGTTVALDHCAFPELPAGRLAADAPLRAVRDMAEVSLKVSTHVLNHAAANGDAGRLLAELAEVFGPERLLWGSDYPQTGPRYGELLETAESAAAALGPAERAGFFGANAIRLFGRAGAAG